MFFDKKINYEETYLKNILLLIIIGCFLAFLTFRVHKNISGTRIKGQKQLIVRTELVKNSKRRTILESIGSNESVDITCF